MRIVIGGNQLWVCPILSATILRRLTVRYGLGIVIVHSEDTGVAESFALAAKGQRIKTGMHLADFSHLGQEALRFRTARCCERELVYA
jgi:hypothetical protein